MKNLINNALSHQHKIFYSLEGLKSVLENLRDKKIVFTGGVFDLFHFGHLNYLERSKALGDVLIVHVDALSPEASRRDKYDGPILPPDKKSSIVASLDFVDFVLVVDKRSYDDEILRTLKPNIFVRVKRPGQSEVERNEWIMVFKKKYPLMNTAYLEPTPELSTATVLENMQRLYLEKNMETNSHINLISMARNVAASGYSYSGFQIGVVASFKGDRIFTGCNISNATPVLTMCAERLAVFEGIKNGCEELESLVLYVKGSDYSTPCGQCRQIIYEFSDPESPAKIILANDSNKVLVTDINKLLPMAFKSNRSRVSK